MKLLLSILMIFSCLSLQAKDKGLTLKRGNTYYIYTSPDAPDVVKHAAAELDTYLTKAIGVHSRKKTASFVAKWGVVVTAVANPAGFRMPETNKLGEDGYSMDISQNSIAFNSQYGRGTLYGVYDFLEKYVGCRWYSSDATVVPSKKSITLPIVATSYSPKVKWREVYYYELCDPEIAAHLRLNGNMLLKGKIGNERHVIQGGNHADWGLWCHSLYDLVSPNLYSTHPEYFAEAKGQRVKPRPDGTQLCLTNPDLVPIATKSLRHLTQQTQRNVPVWGTPLAHYWSVSQMDGRGNCTCEKCLAADRYDGSPSGTMLKFVNQIADSFPDLKIATLAYTYTRKAPLHTKPAKNVVIQMCAIETAREGINFPIATSDMHASFRRDLVDWGRISNEILVWDYEIQFQNLLAPFPNYATMQDNIRFYIANNVAAIFCQGNREKGGEFAELRGYLLAKLLWNPDCDVQKEMDDFIMGYYGKGGVYIKQYINEMELALAESGKRLSMDGEPEEHSDGFLSEKHMNSYRHLFDQAEKAVANNKVFLDRIRKERLGIMYAQVRLGYGSAAERSKLVEQICQIAKENDIWMFSEVETRKDQSGNRDMFFKRYHSAN